MLRTGCGPTPRIGAHEDRKILGNVQPLLFSDSSSPESFLLHSPQPTHPVNPCAVLRSFWHVHAMCSQPAEAYAHGAVEKSEKDCIAKIGILAYG